MRHQLNEVQEKFSHAVGMYCVHSLCLPFSVRFPHFLAIFASYIANEEKCLFAHSKSFEAPKQFIEFTPKSLIFDL